MPLPLLPTAPSFAFGASYSWLLLCWFAFQRAALFRATVLAPLLGHPLRGLLPSVVGGYHEKRPISASLRPLDIYIYVFGSQSCATRLVFVGSARLRPKTKPRMAPLVEFVALRVPSASLPFHTAMLPRLSLAIRVVIPRRRNTGSLPHSRLSAQFANRIPACHSAQRSVTLPASSPHVKPLQATTTATN